MFILFPLDMSIDIIWYKWHKIKVLIIGFSLIIYFISVYRFYFCLSFLLQAYYKYELYAEKHLHNSMRFISKSSFSITILLKYINMFNITSFRKRYSFFYNFKCIFRIRR